MSNKPKPKTKFVGTLLGALVALFAVAGLVVLSTSHFLNMARLSLFMRAPTEKKFMSAWDADIKHLDQAHYLPAGFHSLRSVKLFTPSAKIKKIFYQYPLELKASGQGLFNLEIFADEIEDGGVVVQYDLIEIKSGNTIWELGRTFPQNLGSAKDLNTTDATLKAAKAQASAESAAAVPADSPSTAAKQSPAQRPSPGP